MNRPKKSLYERIADSYGNYTVERGLVSKEEGPIQAYGMLVVLCNGTTYLLILLLSFILHCVARTVLFLLLFSVVRIFTGGHHEPTPLRCTLLSIAIWLLAMMLSIVAESGFRIYLLSAACVCYGLFVIFLFHRNRKGDAIGIMWITIVMLLAMAFWLVGFMKISCALLSVPIVCLLTCSERGQEH